LSYKKASGLAGLAASIVSAFSISVTPAANAQENYPAPDLSIPSITLDAPPAKTLADFEIGKCYAPNDLVEYLTLTGEKPIVRFDKSNSLQMGPMKVKVPSEIYLLADQDSWSFMLEGIARNSGKICLADRGETLEYVSLRDKYYQQVQMDDATPASTTRQLELEKYQKEFGMTPFIKGITSGGATFDVLVSMSGSWTVLLTAPDGSATRPASTGHNYEMIRPNFENAFGMFHMDNYVRPENLAEPSI
jgi:hypothetical protein